MNALAQKSRLSAEERKQSILIAAAPLFAEHGLRGVTTKQIAANAGVSEALLYRHFPSKDQLFTEVQDALCKTPNSLADALRESPPGTQSLVTFVFLWSKSILLRKKSFGPDADSFTKLMMRSLMDDGEFAKHFIERNVAPWQQVFEAHVNAAVASGDIVSPLPSNLTFWFCHHLIVHLNMVQMPETKVVDLQHSLVEVNDHLTIFLLRGLGMTPEAIDNHFDSKRLHEAEVWEEYDA